MRERDARMALCCTVEPATIDITRQVQQQGAEAIWQGLVQPSSRSRWARRAQAFDLADMQAATDRLRLRFIVPGDRHMLTLDIKYAVANTHGKPETSRELVITNWDTQFSGGLF